MCVKLPLLAGEVTGSEAILSFSQKMVSENYRSAGPAELKGWAPTAWSVATPVEPQPEQTAPAATGSSEFKLNDRVKIDGLQGAAQYNGYSGKVVDLGEDGRIGVEIIYKAVRYS